MRCMEMKKKMSKEQLIDLKRLRPGDKITVTFEVVKSNDDFNNVSFLNGNLTFYFSLNRNLYGTVERALRPLAVGDRVTYPADAEKVYTGQILCIAGTQAWVENEFGNRFTAYLHELTRIDD